MRKRLAIVVAVVLALALVAVGLLWWRDHSRTPLERAASMAPSDAERISWTDWAAVRGKMGADLSADSPASALNRFLDKGYSADLTSTSALVQSAPVLQEHFGFSPANADWELFSQSTQGAVVMIHLPDGTDFGALEDKLAEIGYERPTSSTGVWRGGEGVLSAIGPDLTPELQSIAFDADDGLVLTSDNAQYLEQAVSDAQDGSGVSDDLSTVIDGSGKPLSASVYAGDYTCSALAMSQADSADQSTADDLLSRAGEVNPILGFSMSVQPDRHVEVVMAFETDDQARTNADTRATLASGPAPGQGGSFSDRFHLGPVTADGKLVTMDLVPRPGEYVLSDLSNGPLLFATC